MNIPPQQQRIWDLIATEGMLNKEIAHRMGITEQTVRNYVVFLLHATGTSNRTQLAIAHPQYAPCRKPPE